MRTSVWMAVVAGVLGAASAARADSLPFAPGEEVGLKVSYLGFGAGELSVRTWEGHMDGVPVWPIELEAKTRGLADTIFDVREHYVSYFDPTTRRALGSDEDSRSGDDHTVIKVRLEGAEARIDRTTKRGRSESTKAVHVDTHDILSAVYHLRTRTLAVGDEITLPVFTGKKAFDLVAKVTRREKVKTDAGTFDSFKIECRTAFEGKFSADDDITVWISADERRLPVRFEAPFSVGTLKVALVRYVPGSVKS